jgi:cell division protein ZapA (FtsZ GTPase activity inhibitor)
VEKIRVNVSILGKEYSIVSQVDPEYIKKAAEYLDMKMREVSQTYPNITEAKIAVLAALNITDELFQARHAEQPGGEAENRIVELTRKLSEIL